MSACSHNRPMIHAPRVRRMRRGAAGRPRTARAIPESALKPASSRPCPAAREPHVRQCSDRRSRRKSPAASSGVRAGSACARSCCTRPLTAAHCSRMANEAIKPIGASLDLTGSSQADRSAARTNRPLATAAFRQPGTRTERLFEVRDRFRGKFPGLVETAELIPCSREKIRCSVA
jgi:hypothetical protein